MTEDAPPLQDQLPQLPLSQDTDVYHDHSDNNFFVSTQVQSRIDDLEEEEQQKKSHRELLQRFVNRAHTEPTQTTVRQGQRSKTDPSNGNKNTKRKPRKTKTKPRSVTGQMISKLSGKPGKLKRMNFYDPNINHLRDELLLLHDDDDHPDNENLKVFTDEEWRNVTTLLRKSVKIANGNSKRHRDFISDKEDWWMGNDEPSGLMSDDMEMLYRESSLPHQQDDATAPENENLLEWPITLSQIVKPIFERVPIPEPEVIEISDSSEIECSEDDGDPIIWKCNQLEPDDDFIVSHVYFKGPPLQFQNIKADSLISTQSVHSQHSVKEQDEEEVYDSMDGNDDWVTSIIEIKRKRTHGETQ